MYTPLAGLGSIDEWLLGDWKCGTVKIRYYFRYIDCGRLKRLSRMQNSPKKPFAMQSLCTFNFYRFTPCQRLLLKLLQPANMSGALMAVLKALTVATSIALIFSLVPTYLRIYKDKTTGDFSVAPAATIYFSCSLWCANSFQWSS